MPVLDYESGEIIDHQYVNGVITFDAPLCCGLKSGGLPNHIVNISPASSVCQDTWESIRYPWSEYTRDTVHFLPARSGIQSVRLAPTPLVGIELEGRYFSDAARDQIDASVIDYRFADVTCPVTTQLVPMLKQTRLDESSRSWPLLAESLSTALAVAVIRSMSPTASTILARVKNGLSPDRKRRVVDFVEANLHKPIGLADLAEAAALSPYHFARSFRASLGVSPVRYVTQRRVAAAQRLLRTAAVSLAAIALTTGFASQSHFSTVFRQSTGVTPAEYRHSVGPVKLRRRAQVETKVDAPSEGSAPIG